MLNANFPEERGARQIYDVAVEMVQTSCGYSIPFFDYVEERDTLHKWAETKGDDGLRDYWLEKNSRTLNGAETGIAEGNIPT